MNKFIILIFTFSSITQILRSQDSKPAITAEELSKKVNNPLASLISLPFQNYTDIGIGKFNGSRNTLYIQPVLPVRLSSKLNLITRIVIPVVAQHNIDREGTHQRGLNDVVATAFFSPNELRNGLTWGVGPVFLLPVATDDLLGAKKIGIGPSALFLKQTGGWTIGMLVNQIWSVAGDKDWVDLSQMYSQPYVSYNWKSGAGLLVSSELTRNWIARTSSVYMNFIISGVTKFGNQSVVLALGPKIEIVAPKESNTDFGVVAILLFVFPK
jgi:hypothetical protein